MRILIAALLLMTALAGCADATEPFEPSTSVEETESADGNETVEETVEVANNTAPIAILGVEGFDIENGTFNTTLTDLNFTIDGTDADGDNLTWELTQNGTVIATGDALPAVANATLDAGNHTFVLTVSDGNLTGESSLLAVIDAAADLGPCGGEPEPCIIAEEAFVTVWSDGRCDATNTVYADPAGLGYLHDRGGPGVPPGGFVLGSGTWAFEESNGIDGLQLTQAPSLALDEVDGIAAKWDCQNGDTLIF